MFKRRWLVSFFVIVLISGASWSAPVTFNDSALFNAVKTQWEAATGGTLSDPPQDTELSDSRFTTLVAKELGITDLTGLEACMSLTDLNLGVNQISDLAPLSGLTNLINLDLGYGHNVIGSGIDFYETGNNLISDLSPLAGLVNLENLSLMGNDGITSLEPIRTMDSLSQLWLMANPITDFSPLSDVADTLTFLGIFNCGLDNADIPILNGLVNLQSIGICVEPNLTDVSGLTAINPSMYFVLWNVPVSDISVVSNYSNLYQVMCMVTQVTTIPDLSNLTNLQLAYFGQGPLTDISGLSGITSLHAVSFDDCEVSDITALASCTNLQDISIRSNQLTDIQPLLDHPNVANFTEVDLVDNPFYGGTPFCDENQLAQLETLAPAANIKENALCGPTHILNITVNGTGDTEPKPGSHPVLADETAKIDAQPVSGSGYAFEAWTGDASGIEAYAYVFMDSDKTVTANFVPGDWTLTINKTGSSGGGTSPNMGVYSYLDGRMAQVSYGGGDGAYFNGWSGDVTGYKKNVSILMDGHKTVTADFVNTGYVLTLDTIGQGDIDGFWGDETYNYASGASFDLTAKESYSLYYFDHWEGDLPGGADPNNAVLPIVMDQDRAITAVFIQDIKTLTVIIEGGGATEPSGSIAPGVQHVYATGSTTWLRAIPTETAAFDHWEGDIGDTDPTNASAGLVMDQDRTVTAVFVPADYTLTVLLSGTGDINPDPGVYGYRSGRSASLDYNLLAGGDAFSHWSGDVNPDTATNRWTSVLMDRNRTVTANFIPGDWTLTVTRSAGEGGVMPGTGVFRYLEGQLASLGVWTGMNSYFAGWTGDITTDTPTVELLMDANKSVSANFEADGYTLTTNVEGHGGLNMYESVNFAANTEPVLKAQQNYTSWKFFEWTGDLPGGADAHNPELPVLMDRDRSITAVFKEDIQTLTIIIEGTGSTDPAGGPAPGIAHNFSKDSLITVAATPGMNGWAFNGWTGDTGFGNRASQYLTVTMDQDRTITANYVTADWDVTIGFTGNGSVWPDPGTYGMLDGAEMEVVANIFENSDAFDHWEGLPEGANSYDIGPNFIVHSDLTITAVFGPGDYSLTTTVSGGGSADYVSHPAGVYNYFSGRYAHLEVRPNAGTYWGGYSGDVNTYDFFYRLLMDGNKNVTINLGTEGYHLTVNQTGGGTTDPFGTVGYMAGSTPTIHAIDNHSIIFQNWSGDLSPGMDPTDRDPEILMDQDRSVTANFSEADFYLYIQVIGNGTTDPAPELYWHMTGDPFEVTATPGAEFLFLQWQGNVPAGQDPASRTISGTIDQNVELIAVFVPESVTVPDLSGKTQAEAEAALAVLGLALGEVTQEYSDTVLLGHVITQNPAAAASVAYGSVVSIVVSRGPCIAPVPNLAGVTQADAETALAAAHLALGVVTQENSAAVPEGQIIRQDPVFGLSVACDTAVAVVISLGPVIEGEGEEGELEGETGCHTADQNCDGLVNLSELLRVIQFFNSGGYHCETGTEDGYAPGPASDKGLQPLVLAVDRSPDKGLQPLVLRQITKVDCLPHSSDYAPQDWLINLSELLRLIQFFNSGGYHYCPGESTEDGFCPGP